MKVFHIDQFKCTLCSNWFCPPYNLPYLLKCTHSICTNCLQKSASSKCKQIICPQDLQKNKISQININQSTKKALQRLMKEHKNFNETNYLQCIKTLSLSFDQILDSKQVQLKNFSQLINQIFQDQIKRLKGLYEKIRLQINRPFRIVNDWKDIVKAFLTTIKKSGNNNSKPYMSQLNHYIQQGRKIKMDINQFSKYNFKQYTDLLIQHPQVCFNHNFSVFDCIKNFKTEKKQVIKNNNLENDSSKKIQNRSILSQYQKDKDKQKYTKDIQLFEKLPDKTPRNQLQKYKQNGLGQLIFSQNEFQSQNGSKKSNYKTANKQQHSPFQLTQQKWINSKFQSPEKEFNQKRNILQQNKIGKVKQNNLEKLKLKLREKQQKNREVLRQIHFNQNCFHDSRLNKKANLKESLEYSPEVQYQNYTFQDSSKRIKINGSPNKYNGHLKKYDINDYDQILLQDDNKPNRNNSQWHIQNYNFLKEWQISQQKKNQIDLQIKQKTGYNCQKEKEKYTKKIQLQRTKQAYDQTMQKANIVQLINCQLDVVDLTAYLSNFDWSQVEILKLVRTSLKDCQINQLLNFLACSNVHTLVLSSNNLTQICIDALLYFVQINKVLKNVYLSKNNINTLKGNTRIKIQLLKEHGINLYI